MVLFWISDSIDFVSLRELSKASSTVSMLTSVARHLFHDLDGAVTIWRPKNGESLEI